jgi:hypothetical protein
MDEVTLLRELGEEIDRTAGEPSPRLRHHVVAGIAGGDRGGRRRSWFTARRVVPAGGLLAGGLALAAVVAAGGPGAGEGTPPRPSAAGTATLDARGILLAAAATARRETTPAPDPKAFVYTRTQERGAVLGYGRQGADSGTYATTREAWLSVDGSRDGAVTPSGSTELVAIPAHETTPAYQADLPTTTAAMRDHLYRDAGQGQKRGADAVAFEAGRALAQESHLPSAVRGALFEAMAAIPGVEFVPDAVNVAGVRGVAVAYSDGINRDELLFDAGNHLVIGTRTVFVGKEAGLPTGTVTYTSAVLESAVVPEVRQRPDGTFREGPIEDNSEKKRQIDKGAGEAAEPANG